MIEHKDITGADAAHPFAYIGTSDPGAVGAGKGWLDTNTTPYILKVRNAGDSAWVAVRDVAAIQALIDASIASLIDGAPGALNTLNELAAALADDASYAATIATTLDLMKTEVLEYAISDEATALTTGTAKLTVRVPYPFHVSAVRSSLSTVSSSGLVTVDINEAGASILSTALSIDASEKTSTTAATPAVISDATLADDAELTFDIDAAGTGAKGLKVKLIGYKI